MHLKKRQRLHFLYKSINGGLLFIFIFCMNVFAEQSAAPIKSAAVISKNIKPYYEALEGYSTKFREIAGSDTEIFELEDYDKDSDPLSGRIKNGGFSVVLAIGPEASRFISSDKISGMVKIYTMIINTDDIHNQAANSFCGVSLSIPPAEQITSIISRISGAKKIGILFDPKYNELFVKKAETEAARQSVRIIRIQVNTHHDITPALENRLGNIDVLWMIPDQTVISESLVPFIIKKSIGAGVPTVGYNRFFLQNGATMAFVINYKDIGAKAALNALKALREKTCSWESPDYEIINNQKIIDMLKLRIKSINENIDQDVSNEHR